MVEEFHPAEKDRAIHKLIAAEIQSALRIQAAFEKKYPNNPRNQMARIQNRPPVTSLYPQAAASGKKWLMPIVERLAWALDRDEKQADALAMMLTLSLEGAGRISEAEFLKLAAFAEAISAKYTYAFITYVDGLGKFLKGIEEAGPLSEPVVAPLRDFVLPQCWKGGWGWFELAWPVFRAEAGFRENDTCWAARVRRDLSGDWLQVFDSNLLDKFAGAGKPGKRSLDAISRLGNQEVERALRRWVAMLHDGGEPALSPMGVIVLQHLLLLCEKLGGDACDEMLCEIGRTLWARADELGWLETYLWVAGRRPEDRAFVGVEALAMNRVTATEQVQRKYEALLSVFGTQARAAEGIGVDGYPLHREPELAAAQQALNRLMTRGAEAVSLGRYVHPTLKAHLEAAKSVPDSELTPAAKAWLGRIGTPERWFEVGPETRKHLEELEDAVLDEFRKDAWNLHAALALRWEWIGAHRTEIGKDRVDVWRQSFEGFGCRSGLRARALARVSKLPLESLIRAVRAGGSYKKVMELSRNYVEECGWDAGLAQALRDWIPTLGTSRTEQEYRAQADWFLWFEDVMPVDDAACWSHRIKRDLRAMTMKHRAAWLALLDNPSFTVREDPPQKWLKLAAGKIGKIGAAAFRKQFAAWFAAFGKGEKLRLTVTGRNVLRVLIWYALLAEDPVVDAALANFASAHWSTKEHARCASQAEMAFAYVLARRAPKQALAILEKWVKGGRAPLGTASRRTYEGLRARLGVT